MEQKQIARLAKTRKIVAMFDASYPGIMTSAPAAAADLLDAIVKVAEPGVLHIDDPELSTEAAAARRALIRWADKAGVRTPSEDTWALVSFTLRQRAEQAAKTEADLFGGL